MKSVTIGVHHTARIASLYACTHSLCNAKFLYTVTISVIDKALHGSIGMVKSMTLREAWAGEADCRNCALRTSVLFAGLTEQDFDHIHEPIDQFDLKPGTPLYQAGEVGDYMFTVRSGSLKLVQYLPDGSQRIVRIVRGTDVLGLEALLGSAYQHDAVALSPSEVCRFPTRVVKALSKDNPSLHAGSRRAWSRPSARTTQACTRN